MHLDVLDIKLQGGSAVVGIFLYSITDIKRYFTRNKWMKLTHLECNTVNTEPGSFILCQIKFKVIITNDP